MSMSSIPSSSPGGKRYGWVEKIGNKVPHPFLLFIYLIAVLIAATAILSALNVGVQTQLTVRGWWSKTCSAWKDCTGFCRT
ncbi:Aminobenzoyl-glutamate transport protein [Klebsiella pneumoniae]|nr:Aminobenzoyl-glutamate transport protein [Klebsiella pneumoniae]